MSKVIIARGKDIVKRTLLALRELSPSLPPKNSRILIKPKLAVIDGTTGMFGSHLYG